MVFFFSGIFPLAGSIKRNKESNAMCSLHLNFLRFDVACVAHKCVAMNTHIGLVAYLGCNWL